MNDQLNPGKAKKLFGETMAVLLVLSILGTIFCSLVLNGIADTINAYGDFMRWLFA